MYKQANKVNSEEIWGDYIIKIMKHFNIGWLKCDCRKSKSGNAEKPQSHGFLRFIKEIEHHRLVALVRSHCPD